MWKIIEIANGRKSCDNSDLESSDIFPTLSILKKNFVISYDKNAGIDLKQSNLILLRLEKDMKEELTG